MDTLNNILDIAQEGDAAEDFRKATRSYLVVFNPKRDGYVTIPQLRWAEMAGGLSVKPGVILALWYRSMIEKSATVKFSSELARQFGVDRRGKYRGLKQLEAAGLVSVVYGKGKSPLVTLLGVK